MILERRLSSNALKLIAAAAMLIDHVGAILLPNILLLRAIGRLAFPMFAFMISEGAKYTRSKTRYFLSVFLTGFVCQVVNYFFNSGSLEMCALITFSISILLIYLLHYSKKIFFESELPLWLRIGLPSLIMLSAVAAVYLINRRLDIDYGFFGCLLPVFASLVDFRGVRVPSYIDRFDFFGMRFALFSLGVLRLSMYYGGIQYLSLLSLVFLAFYSEKRGERNMKYFFYLFFPLHLAFLYGVRLILIYFLG